MSRSTRVALVLATSTGGVGQHVRSLAGGLVRRGYDVAVLGPSATEELFGFTQVGARFAAVEIAAGIDPRRDAAAVRSLRRLLKGSDVVHAHGFRAGFVAAAAQPRDRWGRWPLVVTWHNSLLAKGSRLRVLAVLERVVARRPDVTLGASEDLVERARSLGARDARLSPVAAPDLAAPTRSRQDVRGELEAGDRPVVLTVGRLHPQKGYDLLLDAAARMSTRRPKPLFVAAGSGPLEQHLAARISTEGLPVSLLGHRSDVANLLAAADVAVLASEWEARPLFAQEALRAGVPLVATRVGGIPGLVGSAAILVPYGDVEELSDALGKVLEDRALAEDLVNAGRVRAAT